MPIQPTTIATGQAIESVAKYSAESLGDMTVSDLKALADSLGCDIADAKKKADIIDKILEHQNGSA